MTAVAHDAAIARPRRRRGSISRDRRWALRWSYFFLVVFAIFFLTPPLYMLITALKTSAEISAATDPWWVHRPTLENFIGLLTSSQYLIFFRNSALVSIIVVAITMLIAVPAAFAVSKEYTGIGLINHWWVLLLLYPTLTVPFCTWIMIGYFASIPKELDEAALVDGASYRQILLRVFIPVALP